ncbi:MAG: DEAD/DEAH box helicase [Isosphaeraceae bacterium]
MIQLNPSFEPGGWVDDLVDRGLLHAGCRKIFRIKTEEDPIGSRMLLHRHQVEAIEAGRRGQNYVLTTGTGSGKSLTYLIPIVDRVLRNGGKQGIQAVVVYPMNALCNSQYGELEKFLRVGFGLGKEPVRFDRYTGQESREQRDRIIQNPPDILLTNYVMLELLLTRPFERPLVNAARDLRFLVLDELHTYRGRQGADVALLVRRLRVACQAEHMLCVGTSATMSSGGTLDQQRQEIAGVATRLFGSEVRPENVIGETLTRATVQADPGKPETTELLRKIVRGQEPIPSEYQAFVRSPLAGWLEDRLGLRREAEGGRLLRGRPRPIVGERGIARELGRLTGMEESACERVIRDWLLAGYNCEEHPESHTKPFAFRLHQFISPGDSVYASLEEPGERHLSLSGQQFVPGSNKARVLLPLAFCRECGAEYYIIWKYTDPNSGRIKFKPREISDRLNNDEDGVAGFLYRDPDRLWPDDREEQESRLPEDWFEIDSSQPRLRPNLREEIPQRMTVGPDGFIDPAGLDFFFTSAPFRFCQNCAVSYRARRGDSDFGRLATLSSGGRSTATTILSLSIVRMLKKDASLKEHAKKLLSFTDNRQDASLQAGHFNDFVEVSLLRSALYKAAQAAGPEGISYDELALRIFKALDLPLELYAREPGVQFAQKADTEKAMRNVIGYRIYRDLKRGWRVTSPNLEQCGLLKIKYVSLGELCRADEFWQGCHASLVSASPQTRENIATVLLDYLRRELAIDVDYLTYEFHERLIQQSSQRLRQPWAVDEQEKPELATSVFPRARQPRERRYFSYLSGRSGFGQYLSRKGVLPEFERHGQKLSVKDRDQICIDLFRVLAKAQFVVEAEAPTTDDGIPGYRVSAACMAWHAGEGARAFHDPIRVPNLPDDGGRTNPFFVQFYRTIAGDCRGFEAHEHTAQVSYEERQEREKDFGTGKLPVLYCSPTMELGVDIRQLNVVNMRNVPPTPANYAQRSGRAGRSGQPALVLTYCAAGNSHDQYFFRRQELMVSGAVSLPRLDLANEDLVRAHVHALWLAETEQYLGDSLTEILDVEGISPSLELKSGPKSSLTKKTALVAARDKSQAILGTLIAELERSTWYKPGWLEQVLNQTMQNFEAACERWRSLFRAAKAQWNYQNQVIADVARQPQWEEAKRLRREAEAQIALLTDAGNVVQSDFYSYRYFASEGFLPGYNFPRLPLSAFIPARKRVQGRDEFLSRPRFLAITEFGPRSIIYHEGSRYIVNKVILPVADGDGAITQSAKQCRSCGYIQELAPGEAGDDLCQNCGQVNLQRLDNLLRLQNVATKRRDRITSDEEERTRLGYEIRCGLRFKNVGGVLECRTGEVTKDGQPFFKLIYGDAATIWRINLGWRRRSNKDRYGFVLDREKGFWQSSDQLPAEEDPGDPMGTKTDRVVPFVEDRRNCLILEPAERLDEVVFTSLQSALKKAIQAVYQLEDNEIGSEPLPSPDDRRQILFYEASEGGAGVLRRLLDEPDAFANVAREALRICHFHPETGSDSRRAEGATEDCEVACYDCLMTYANQREHELLDRHTIKETLLALTRCTVLASPTTCTFSEHLEALKQQAGSGLERQWLDYLARRGLHLPSDAQKFITRVGTRPDFFYDKQRVAIYVDGPPHLLSAAAVTFVATWATKRLFPSVRRRRRPISLVPSPNTALFSTAC